VIRKKRIYTEELERNGTVEKRRKGDEESYERDKELQDQEQYHGINRTKVV
jgi:hypothetical protein